MLKKYHFLLLFLLLAQYTWAQKPFVSNNPKYISFILRADSAFEKKNYAVSMLHYDSAFAVSQKSAYSLYQAARCAAFTKEQTKLFSYLHKSIEINPLAMCKWAKEDSIFQSVSKEVAWKEVEKDCESRKNAFLAKINSPLLMELQQMCQADMEARKLMEVLKQKNDYKSPEFKKQKMLIESIEVQNLANIKGIIEKYGWVGYSLVGEEGEKAAWYLVCHADADIPFQKHCLTLMSQAADKGEANHAELAFLMDKVLVNEHQPQLYGTQLQFNQKTQQYEARVGIADKAYLDIRRETMGLESWKTFVERVKKAEGRK